MSALAELLLLRGCTVTGTDRTASPLTNRLVDLGIQVGIGHRAEAVSQADLVIYTPAVSPDNPELAEAARRGLPTMKRAALLGLLARDQQVVAVTGTHGKTTTTAMTGAVLKAAGMDPTILVGGIVQGDERNFIPGSGSTWVLEADEYDRSFHELQPHVAVVTSLEADHLDAYGSMDAIVDAYRTFLAGMPAGVAVLNGDAPSVAALPLPAGVVRRTFGLVDGDVHAGDVTGEGTATRFPVLEDRRPAAQIELRLPGRHNVMNALAAASVGRSLGVPWDSIAEGLAGFQGVHRRFEVVGEAAGVTVVSDYAHHPTAIAETLKTAKERRQSGRVVVLFQPHLYSRTRDFAEAFGEALALADRVFVTDVYAARETPIPGVDGALLAQETVHAGQPAVTSVPALAEAVDRVVADVRSGDMLLVIGAGDVESAAPAILQRLLSSE